MPSTEESGPVVTTVEIDEAADTAQVPAVEAIDGPERLGKYRLLRHLATGGMAEIYLAEQVGPEGFAKQIVIKSILPHLAKDRQFTDMFLDEARLAANLNHPNIGQIYELGREGGDYYIAMEYIDGASLEELVESDTRMPPDVSARIVADVLQALDFAHEFKDREGKPLGIVHRDVTPSNVMASRDGIVKLVDFGVAKAAKKSHKTQTGAVKGKFAYMAPEQVESAEIDRRADIFSIGIVFYELLTGERPFGEELAAVSRILHDDPQNPLELDPQIPEPYVRIVMRALEKDPEKRYPTAHTMLLDIETALRMRNSYVGPREISYVVREFRGLPLPAGADPSVSDTGVFAADRSGDIPRENLALMETMFATETPRPDTAAEDSAAAQASRSISIPIPRVRVTPRRIAIAAAAAAAVVVVAGAVSFAGREHPSPLVTGQPQTVVLNTAPLVEKGANPAALRDDDGAEVVIDTIPSTRLYKGQTFVGTTPFQTRLHPGKYRVDFVRGDERKTAVVDVRAGAFNRARFDFDELGQKKSSPKSKRHHRRSAGARFKAKLRRLLP